MESVLTRLLIKLWLWYSRLSRAELWSQSGRSDATWAPRTSTPILNHWGRASTELTKSWLHWLCCLQIHPGHLLLVCSWRLGGEEWSGRGPTQEGCELSLPRAGWRACSHSCLLKREGKKERVGGGPGGSLHSTPCGCEAVTVSSEGVPGSQSLASAPLWGRASGMAKAWLFIKLMKITLDSKAYWLFKNSKLAGTPISWTGDRYILDKGGLSLLRGEGTGE